MEATTLLLLSAIIIAAFLFLSSRDPKKLRLIKLTENLPGPTGYPIVGTALPFILVPRHKRMKLLEDRMKTYQPICRVWLGSVLAVNVWQPEHAEALLSSMKNLDKSFTYKYLHPWLGTGLLTSTGQKWHTHRKMITPTFHFKILEDYVEVFSEKSKILINKLQKEVGSKIFNMYPYITRCALDIICGELMAKVTIFGTRL